MEEELNYLSEKIKKLSQEVCELDDYIAEYPNMRDIKDYEKVVSLKNKKISILTNILNELNK